MCSSTDDASRLAVSAVSSWSWSFEEDLAFWVRAGIDQVGLSLRKLEVVGIERATEQIRRSGLRVASVGEVGWFLLSEPAQWGAQRDRLTTAVEVAGSIGAGCVVVVTGPPGPLDWDAAADAFATAIEPVAERARDAGVSLAVENTSPLRLDLSFVTTLRDAIALAQLLGLGVCMEIGSCWAERDLNQTIARDVAALALVQVSDYVVGSLTTPDRAVPGDGDIPLGRILRALADAGYAGRFELELVGPRIEQEGYASALTRAVASTKQLLRQLRSTP